MNPDQDQRIKVLEDQLKNYRSEKEQRDRLVEQEMSKKDKLYRQQITKLQQELKTVSWQ